jgi:hypothetical protein
MCLWIDMRYVRLPVSAEILFNSLFSYCSEFEFVSYDHVHYWESYLSIRFTVAFQRLQKADIYRSLILRIERDTVCGPELANNGIRNGQ